MNDEKNKILKMLEEKRINAGEAAELLGAIEKLSPARERRGIAGQGELKMIVYGQSGAEVKKFSFPLEEIVVSALMNKINLELKHSGISASMEEIRDIKESVMGNERFVLNKNQRKVEIWME